MNILDFSKTMGLLNHGGCPQRVNQKIPVAVPQSSILFFSSATFFPAPNHNHHPGQCRVSYQDFSAKSQVT